MPKVTFVPREVAETIPENGELMVSIAHPGEIDNPDCWPRLDHWPHLIRMLFDDIEPPACGMTLLSIEDAQRLIDKIAASGGDVIVHCAAGMSRSAAIAKWLADHRGYELWMHPQGVGTTDYYNRHVYKTMQAADGNDMAAYYEELELCDRMMSDMQ